MLELLCPTAAFNYALRSWSVFKSKIDLIKEDYKCFFEVSGIAIKKDDRIQYPTF